MSVQYSVSSTGSYMKAMQAMVDALERLQEPAVDLATPKIDTEEHEIDLGVLAQFDDIQLSEEISDFSSDTDDYDDDGGANAYDDLMKECKRVAKTKEQLSQQELADTIVSTLTSESSLDSLQSFLFDILGFEEFDLISKIIADKDQILSDMTKEPSHEKIQKEFLSERDIRNQVKKNQQTAKSQDLAPAETVRKYPNVYKAFDGGNTVAFNGQKFTLPVGSTREQRENYEEITIPIQAKKFKRANEVPVHIRDLDTLCQGTFKGYSTLNRMQSLVYPVAYNTNENMLVCAPTGAGKTDVALLTILHTIGQFMTETDDTIDIDYSEFKIVYVAPLKALAAEIVEKFSKKLAWLGIQVRELTGDMQLTKSEIIATQVIVTTPEKWDVVTRKGNGDDELVSKVQLLIIDEVHLLHEDRGSVIETLVARTLRQVESTQSMIRVVGLSATLPNFVDVADFLGVNREIGMFFFDQSFRPVPLKQQLIGVKGKAGSKQARENIDRVTYDKLIDELNNGAQVMVFVHSRKDTQKTARTFISMAQENNEGSYFDCTESTEYERFKREMSKNHNKDTRELFQHGFGIHHAGMLRSDRNLTEKMFMSGAIKVLCCTATLAWGVNLPAAVVIVKGTQVYDSKKGGFTDLGISDVIQIFGRAGRPQFEKYGTGILCTTSDRLDDYVRLLTSQHPIESKLSAKIVDNLNAEISLGTVTNVDEGVKWLGFTYMFTRMRQNPFAYGIDWKELAEDPQLVERRTQLIISAARRLHFLQMIIFDERSMHFVPKDLGRVASDFYLLNDSVEIFNQICSPTATEADVLSMISMSSEFDSIKFREEEAVELTKLLENRAKCQIGAELSTAPGKTNILLQAFISQASINDSALYSDSNYVAQNSIRICRALFLIGIHRRWGIFAKVLLSICKSIERRLWSFEHPLKQFELPQQIIRNLEAKNTPMEDLRMMESRELGDLVHNTKMGSTLYKLIGRLPYILIEGEIFPITKNVMRVHVSLEPDFVWDEKYHGGAQIFWVLVEESDKNSILHFEKFILNRKQLKNPHEMDFMIPLADPLPPQIVIRVVSDSWIGSETTHSISFQHLIRPHNETLQTKLLKLQPLPITALHDSGIEAIYKPKFRYFNAMQTMTFHTLYNTNSSVFVGSPTGSGKTVVAELAIWHAFNEFPGSKIVYIAPMKALVRERVDDWRERLTKTTGHKVVELTGDSIPAAKDVREASIIITTPEKFDGISRNWQTRKFVQQVSLVIMDEIHLLASDRGPILEMIVSRMNYMSSQTNKPIRLLGMSTAVSNAFDMAGWLGVREGLFNFPSSVRPVPLEMYIDGFQDNLAFCPLMKTMNKPAFMAIKAHSPTKPVLIFVASRRQTRLTALDLIHLCGLEDNPRRFLKMDEFELEDVLKDVKDETLRLSLQFGIGLHHAGLVDNDRKISHKLFESNKIQILIATSTLAWGVNLPAHLVIIKGTQFFDAKIEAYRDMDLTDILQMMGRAGRPAYDTSGIAIVYTKESKKMFYKHFLNVGFPVESSLHKVLDNHIGAEISAGTIKSRQDAMDFLTWTFLYRRAHNNPTYYDIQDTSTAGVGKYLSDLIDATIKNLQESSCVIAGEKQLIPTAYLNISSYYYLSHLTIRNLVNQISSDATFRECLRLLSEAIEYNELPTRHGEELINMEMSQNLRYPSDDLVDKPIWDPHIKTYLLLQAYMSRVDLPIADYSQDTVSVLDQALRILQAYIDVASELGYLQTTLIFIKIMQCIKQGIWFDDDPVSSLPGLDLRRWSGYSTDGLGTEINGLSEIQRRDELEEGHGDPGHDGQDHKFKTIKSKFTTLKEIGGFSYGKLNGFMKRIGVDESQKREFVYAAQHLPVGDFHVEQSESDSLKVQLKHHNEPVNSDFKMLCAKFPKLQKESWFVILCDLEFNELLVVKRAAPILKKGSKKGVVDCELSIPSELKGSLVNVLMVNDAFDLQYGVQVELKY
ncbi:U5 small nuclear ribonucleoprotein [Wickerhamomyces ciferrii]|uniref:U5 small nuclear ribonucleoprotein n=1 Tax=Wickerhamomyces ciferrii (strain ATCC 14091 / BCRC 22168 / CBS 111 / JCM 3599 / NBRC 0793 / NRRL Y-1031 F-60-10) TaxID=1206466 RepID=K0KKL2_WICCF|nr:U5 small nuclear ribonucleoprotein [Wickerhamomyces ciferrii]CCH41658.1 U5 small nuclear ribonucleoprotein [Wickerhamomyces ciferrii]